MKGSSPADYFTQLLSLARGYMCSSIFLTALDLHVFGKLGMDKFTPPQIAEELNTHERGTEILLNALAAMGLLKKKGGLFFNHRVIADLFNQGSPLYQGGVFEHTVHLWKAWANLTEIVRTGQPFKKGWTCESRANFALFMKQYSRGVAERLPKVVDCSDIDRMLDLGSGPGSYSVSFARSSPRLRIVSFDKDEQALQITMEEIEKENLKDRVEVKQGDFFADDLGKDYDLALLSSILCLFGEDECIFLLKRVKESLKKGGRITILDLMLEESKTEPVASAMFAVNLLVTTQYGRCYTFGEVKRWLLLVGFKKIHQIPIEPYTLIAAEKGDERDLNS